MEAAQLQSGPVIANKYIDLASAFDYVLNAYIIVVGAQYREFFISFSMSTLLKPSALCGTMGLSRAEGPDSRRNPIGGLQPAECHKAMLYGGSLEGQVDVYLESGWALLGGPRVPGVPGPSILTPRAREEAVSSTLELGKNYGAKLFK